MPLPIRDAVVQYSEDVVSRSDFSRRRIIDILGIRPEKYYRWKKNFGVEHRTHYKQPKAHWLLSEEREAIIAYAKAQVAKSSAYGRHGYRRLAYMMIDANICTCSPATVYNILHEEGLLNRWNKAERSLKGTGFEQPTRVHQHWHTDIKYVNFRGTFLYFISVLDGFSRYLLHFELRKSMTELDIALVLQRAMEKYPEAKPRLISDNGKQFVAHEFKKFLNDADFTHVRTSPMYPQSNGKIERFHRSLSEECISTSSFIDMDDAKEQFTAFVGYYNDKRLHSSLNYLPPRTYLDGTYQRLLEERKEKIRLGYEKRRQQNMKKVA